MSEGDAKQFGEIDDKIKLLLEHRKEWLKVSFAERCEILEEIAQGCVKAQEKVTASLGS